MSMTRMGTETRVRGGGGGGGGWGGVMWRGGMTVVNYCWSKRSSVININLCYPSQLFTHINPL